MKLPLAPLMRATAIGVVLASCFALSACEGDSPEEAATADTKTYEYRGETISCLRDGTGNMARLTCDFITFYNDHPSLREYHDVGVEANVYWLKTDGSPLACVSEGTGDSSVMACDWPRYHAARAAAVIRSTRA